MGDNINSEGMRIPEHIAIILDGNGRWAKKRFLPRNAGHIQGSKNVEGIGKIAYDMGVKYVTMYAFSTENWKRPKDEVKKLMELLNKYVRDHIKKCKKNNMKFRVIGDIDGLGDELKNSIYELLETSKDCTGLNFNVALNYGSRDEIIRGIKKLSKDVDNKIVNIDDLSEEMFSSYLDTFDIPDPDMVIRTSGEQRLSNFLMWQLAYAEMYFTDVLWPDFKKEDLEDAIRFYNTKERRFGGVK